MINIDELKYNFDKPFLDLMDGIETMVHPKLKFATIFHKNNKWFFEYYVFSDNQNSLGVNISRVITLLNQYMDSYDIRYYLKFQMKRYFNITFEYYYTGENNLDPFKQI